MLLVIVLFLIFMEAIYEALYDNGKKTLSGLVEFIYRAVIIVMALLWLNGHYQLHLKYIPLYKSILGLLFLRFALFDLVYNLIRKLPVFYIGSTKIYDKIWSWFFSWTGIPKEHFFLMFKIIFLCVGTSLLV